MNLATLVSGKVIVVTGASRGLGAGLADAFGDSGARLGLCARSASARPASEHVVTAELDVADERAVDDFTRAVERRFGAIDLWINNAGLLEPIAPLRDVEGPALRRHLETNIVGVWAGSRSYLHHRDRVGGGGILLNISSGAGRKPYFGWSAYCAGKAAVDRMTECIAVEEAARGLRVHAVAPGIIDTDMQTLIRATPVERFAEVERFKQIKANESFSTPAFVAARLAELAFDSAHLTRDVLVTLPLEHPRS
jgi:benzil reductase ((S)-benzoin forming)